jgi:hypothetical protein
MNQRRWQQFAPLALSMMILSGCSTISEEECKIGDWYSIGVNDGKAGKNHDAFRSYQKECADVGVVPDFKTYQQGHQQGLVFYCDYEHGIEHGRSGASYNTLCTGKLEPEFRRGYQQGRIWFQAKSRLDEIKSAYAQVQNSISNYQREIERNNQLIVQEPDANRRAALLYRNESLRRDIERMSTDLGRLQMQLGAAQHEFNKVDR